MQTEGMDILIIYDEDIGIALKQVCNDDSNSAALILPKVYTLFRRKVCKLN